MPRLYVKFVLWIELLCILPITLPAFLLLADLYPTLKVLHYLIFCVVFCILINAMCTIVSILPKFIGGSYPVALVVKEHAQYGMEIHYKDEFGTKVSKQIADVYNIICYNDYYIIKFSAITANMIICQKSLLVEGTLDDFEKLFEGKIISKIK